MYTYSIELKKSVYPKVAVLKAAYGFIEENYIHIDDNGESWIVSISAKQEQEYSENIGKDFENDLLAQTVRYSVYQETHTVRELLLARAMTSTMIENAEHVEEPENSNDDISEEQLDEILTSWFENHE